MDSFRGETIMKFVFILSLIALLNLFNNAQAVTIDVIQNDVAFYADSVTGSNGGFFDQSFVYDSSLTAAENFSSPLSTAQIATAVTGGDLTTFVRTPDANLSTDPNYVNNSYIDLSFGDTVNAINGDGVDLALFFAGNATKFRDGSIENYLVNIEIGGVQSGLLGVTTSETSDIYSDKYYASYALIDLADFGFGANAAMGDIRIFLGDSSMPALAAVGAYNATAYDATVVPLPLSSVLFGSGLALLSLFRRKKV
jgi:hypothetical protein